MSILTLISTPAELAMDDNMEPIKKCGELEKGDCFFWQSLSCGGILPVTLNKLLSLGRGEK